MYKFKATTFFIHAAGWLMFLAFPLLFMNRTQDSSSSAFVLIFSPYYWLFCLTYMLMFYLNAWYLVPRFVFDKRYVDYVTIILVLFLCIYFLQPYDNLLKHNLRESPKVARAIDTVSHDDEAFSAGQLNADTADLKNLPFGPLPNQDLRMQDPRFKSSSRIIFIHQAGNIDMVGLFIFVIIIGFSIAISTVDEWQNTQQKVSRAQAEKATAELSFLRAQINPHFLFNTLNNIYTLSVTNNENTSDSIMKLSNIMRYVTDDVAEDFVSLQNEIDCIRDFIDLQRLRLSKKTSLNFNIIGDITHQKIAPLILMTFIENVFKYGISNHKETVINIELTIGSKEVYLFCQNPVLENKPDVKRIGIGISNTKKRLEHLYASKHQLNITSEPHLFTVQLTMEC